MGRAIGIIVLLVLLALAIFWIYRGPSPPMDQIAAAKQRAQDSIAHTEAHRYAPDAVSQIQRTIEDIDREVDAQQKKLPFQRNYDAVLDLLGRLDQQVQGLESMSRANKDALSESVAAEIEMVIETLNAIDKELRDMPSAKGSRPALGAMRSDLGGIRKAIEEAQAMHAQGQFQQAQQKTAKAKADADALLEEILDTKERVRALQQRNIP